MKAIFLYFGGVVLVVLILWLVLSPGRELILTMDKIENVALLTLAGLVVIGLLARLAK